MPRRTGLAAERQTARAANSHCTISVYMDKTTCFAKIRRWRAVSILQHRSMPIARASTNQARSAHKNAYRYVQTRESLYMCRMMLGRKRQARSYCKSSIGKSYRAKLLELLMYLAKNNIRDAEYTQDLSE